MQDKFATLDGNEAVARVAYATNEVIAIYPITPATPMGEFADGWSAAGLPNAWSTIPQVVEMQSEGGAAGALHGSLQAGALTTTFTASQGLLLMLPNMFKIAGELTPSVIHVAARSLATHALSIFGDHSDVMAARTTGYGLLASSSVQEAHDLALVAQAATLRARVPLLHFFDGFRTSHEINKIRLIDPATVEQMIDTDLVLQHRERSLDPDRPVLRGTAQNPDVFFQAREAVNPFYDAMPDILQEEMDRFAELTGRQYKLFDYVGAADAEHVLVMMGSGCGAAEEAVNALNRDGGRVGLLKVRAFRPFDVDRFIDTLPDSVKQIAVLDRTKEPGAVGEPLYQDVVTAVTQAWWSRSVPIPRVIGGRYGLSSKEFTPAMAMAVVRELAAEAPKQHFTIGIHDDVTLQSLAWDEADYDEPEHVTRAVFYGLGSDGTVGANKNTVKILGENTPLHTQGYFVYDSKKAGAVTVSHLRFSPEPIESTYLIRQANFVACHQFNFLQQRDVLEIAAPGATFLLNCPYDAEAVWDHLPEEIQRQIIDKNLQFYVIDAGTIARENELGGRINTVMQTCFFALSGVLPMDEAMQHMQEAVRNTYGKRGPVVVERNLAAIAASTASIQKVTVPDKPSSTVHLLPPVPLDSPDFVQRVTGMMIAGKGDLLPVSALPVDGTFPTGTAQYEKRNIADQIPIWDADLCIECGLCAMVCPHAAIRTKRFDEALLDQAPEAFPVRIAAGGNGLAALTIQVAPEDCTGCGVCVDVCPAKSKEVVKHKAIDMLPKSEHLERERERFGFFDQLPDPDRTTLNTTKVKDAQLMLPLFEYSGACGGCGETPYLKLLSQLFGDRMVVANATGCSSIYGGNLPTTPWSTNAQGRGPAWSNSLFEDNAEFGLGMRLGLDGKRERARALLTQLRDQVDGTLAGAILDSKQRGEAEIQDQRDRIDQLKQRLASLGSQPALELAAIADSLVERSVWIVGGDGWAYDIGYGGLDHVLASGRNVNIIVLDTGVYSNTGGQASKATPRAATAKFAADGRNVHRKDLGAMAVAYGSVYVAQIAMGANPAQTLRAVQEAESYDGPSLLLAYSHCIAHGIDMSTAMTHQRDLVRSGFWPLYRYDPRDAHAGEHPFHLDSRKPSKPFKEVAMQEARFAMLARSKPERARELMELAQKDIDDTWHYYQQLAGVERDNPDLQQTDV
ncbi:pyruvate:ferredoxin (flavodoxin) oxidoreductase [Planctomycetes bacterium TBK1r]|uniref:Pyruvate-flavodoxin oxidoreductase n=1 Tax=Stieleria magnilauensis TaxID=2527963 RepID=A0ABX5XNR8_9BACT|nr:Pyruvate-flavodoxin oxidoreductase [Planctomycetes bacterium TBK1r]